MSLWSALRDARYALPGRIERLMPGPDAAAAARLGDRLNGQGMSVSFGYFQSSHSTPDEILGANLTIAGAWAGRPGDAYLSVKAPPLGFDRARIAAIVGAGLSMVFDAHTPAQADATLDLVERFAGSGCALPARWQRSAADADRLRDTPARLRIVKGEWADPARDPTDRAAAYLALVDRLAGRAAMVAIATHDPALAEQALARLIAAGTPCELEQLRGLPRRRTVAVARALGVTVRVYVPFGPGWWPYAVDKALARPYLPLWMVRDWLGIID